MSTYTTTGFAGHVETWTFVPNGESFVYGGQTWLGGLSISTRTGAKSYGSVREGALVTA